MAKKDTKKETAPALAVRVTATAAAAQAQKRTDVVQYRTIRDGEICPPPKRHHESDTGHDLAASTYTVIMPRTRVQVPHNMAVAMPKGHFGLILPRASMMHAKGLLIQPAVIDEGYRGELFTLAMNVTDRAVHINEGDHISQILILPRAGFEFLQVRRGDLPKGDRGDSGFGSTGS